MLLNSHISAYARCLVGKVCSLVRSIWGTPQGEDKLGARDKILNTKVASQLNIPKAWLALVSRTKEKPWTMKGMAGWVQLWGPQQGLGNTVFQSLKQYGSMAFIYSSTCPPSSGCACGLPKRGFGAFPGSPPFPWCTCTGVWPGFMARGTILEFQYCTLTYTGRGDRWSKGECLPLVPSGPA